MIQLRSKVAWFYFVTVLYQLCQLSRAACRLENIQACEHVDKLRGFNAFYTREILSDQCRALRSGVDCALNPAHVKDCSKNDLAPYVAHDRLTKAVCEDYRYAYEKGAKCFANDDTKNFITDCITEIHSFAEDQRCLGYNDARLCARDLVTEQPDCSNQDASLMGLLVDLYLQPFSELSSCEWRDFGVGNIATPPPTTKPKPTPSKATRLTSSQTTRKPSTTTTSSSKTTTSSTTTKDPEGGVDEAEAGRTKQENAAQRTSLPVVALILCHIASILLCSLIN